MCFTLYMSCISHYICFVWQHVPFLLDHVFIHGLTCAQIQISDMTVQWQPAQLRIPVAATNVRNSGRCVCKSLRVTKACFKRIFLKCDTLPRRQLSLKCQGQWEYWWRDEKKHTKPGLIDISLTKLGVNFTVAETLGPKVT